MIFIKINSNVTFSHWAKILLKCVIMEDIHAIICEKCYCSKIRANFTFKRKFGQRANLIR